MKDKLFEQLSKMSSEEIHEYLYSLKWEKMTENKWMMKRLKMKMVI